MAAAGIAAGVTITSPHFTTPVIDSGGLTITAGSLAIGTTPAGAGLIRLPNNNAIDWRNAANTNDHTLSFNSSDQFQITTNMTTTLLWDGSAQILQLASNAVPAGGGIIRVPNNKSINWRNAANTADDALNFDASDRLAVTTIAGNVTTTIGAAGGAAAMPTPVEYLTVVINGNARKIAAFNP